jgi:CHAT domain-containing protein/HEAT repeat protein
MGKLQVYRNVIASCIQAIAVSLFCVLAFLSFFSCDNLMSPGLDVQRNMELYLQSRADSSSKTAYADAHARLTKSLSLLSTGELLVRLKHADSDIRHIIARLLLDRGDHSAISGLLGGFPYDGCKQKEDCMYMEESIASLVDERSKQIVIKALKHKKATTRAAAVRILGLIGGADSVEALGSQLSSANRNVRNSSCQAIKDCGFFNKPSVDKVINLLFSEDKFARLCALEALGDWGIPSTSGHILRVLFDEDPDVKKAAIQAVGRMDAHELFFLESTISDGSSTTNPAIAGLLDLLKDPDSDIVLQAIYILRKWSIQQAVEHLSELQQHASARIREDVIGALIELDKPNAIRYVRKALADPDVEVVRRAFSHVDEAGIEIVPDLINHLSSVDWDIRRRAHLELVKYGKNIYLKDVFIRLLKESPYSEIRTSSLTELGGFPEDDTLSILFKYLSDEDPSMQNAAFAGFNKFFNAFHGLVCSPYDHYSTSTSCDNFIGGIDEVNTFVIRSMLADRFGELVASAIEGTSNSYKGIKENSYKLLNYLLTVEKRLFLNNNLFYRCNSDACREVQKTATKRTLDHMGCDIEMLVRMTEISDLDNYQSGFPAVSRKLITECPLDSISIEPLLEHPNPKVQLLGLCILKERNPVDFIRLFPLHYITFHNTKINYAFDYLSDAFASIDYELLGQEVENLFSNENADIRRIAFKVFENYRWSERNGTLKLYPENFSRHFLTGLHDPDPDIRVLAINHFRDGGIKHYRYEIAKLLDDNHEKVSDAAHRALVELGFGNTPRPTYSLEEAKKLLLKRKYRVDIPVLSSINPFQRTEISQSSISLLHLHNHNHRLKDDAISLLRILGDSSATDALLSVASSDISYSIRQNAFSGLAKIDRDMALQYLSEALTLNEMQITKEHFNICRKEYDVRCAELLLSATDHPLRDVRKKAQSILLANKDERAAAEIVKRCDKWCVHNEDLVCKALKLLDEKSSSLASPIVVPHCNRPHRTIFKPSEHDLKNIRRIADSLNDPDWEVRRSAMYMLLHSETVTATSFLISHLRSKNIVDLRHLIPIIIELKDKRAIPYLKMLLQDRRKIIQAYAALALASVGYRPVIEELLDNPYISSSTLYRISDLRSIGASMVSTILEKGLKSENNDDVKSMIKHISCDSNQSLFDSLRSSLPDMDSETSVHAIFKLGECVVPGIENELIRLLNRDNSGIRVRAVVLLEKYPHPATISSLELLLNDCDYDVHNAVVYALLNLKAYEPVARYLEKSGDLNVFHILSGYSKDMSVDTIGILVDSSDKKTSALGYLLLSLRASNNVNYDLQFNTAITALSYLEHEIDTALTLGACWLAIDAALALGRVSQAREFGSKAENILPFLSDTEREVFTQNFESGTYFLAGEILLATGNKEIAAEKYSQSLRAFEIRRGRVISSNLYFNVKQSLGRWSKSPTETLFSRYGSYQLKILIRTKLGTLQIEQGKENLEKALEGRKAIERPGAKLIENDELLYFGLARQRIADGDYKGAQQLIEEYKLRRMRYLQEHSSITLSDPVRNAALNGYRSRTADIENTVQKLAALDASENSSKNERSKSSKNERRKLSKQLSKLRRDLKVYLTEIKKEYPDLGALLGISPVDLTDLQVLMPEDQIVLQYLILNNRVIIFAITYEDIRIVENAIAKDILYGEVKTYLNEITGKIADEDNTTDTAVKLGDSLFRSVMQQIDLNRIRVVTIVPNGVLHSLPFASLVINGDAKKPEYLIDRFDINYANTTSIMASVMKKKHNENPDGEFVAYANPDGTLPFAESSAKEIAHHFRKKQVFIGEKASKTSIGTIPSRIEYLHFGTHGVFNKNDSMKNYLMMYDGELTVEEIWGLPLYGTRLVTLTACDTGLGEIMSGDDVISLESAFIFAGSSSVLFTLWKVEEETATRLTTLFYAEMMKGRNKAQALSSAQKQIRKNHRHPFFWAAFNLRGNWQ